MAAKEIKKELKEEPMVKEETNQEDEFADMPLLIPIKSVIDLLFTEVVSASHMGGCRCSYKSCSNTTTPWKTIHFFHYPVKQPEICSQWIKNAEKPRFAQLSDDQLRNKVVCEYHFEDRYFPNAQRKRLIRGAVPTLDGVVVQPKLEQPDQHNSVNRENTIPKLNLLSTPKINCISSNGDHAVFLLEDAMTVPKTENVESYIYQNGSLVPSKAVEKVGNNGLQIAESHEENMNYTNHSIFQDASHEDPRNIPGTSSDENTFTALYWDTSTDRTERETSLCHNNQVASTSGLQTTKGVVRNNTPPEPHVTPSCNEKLDSPNQIEKQLSPSKVETRLSEKIRKNSREIAAIKKYLRRTRTSNRSFKSKTCLLQALKAHVPPTLYSVLKLALTNSGVSSDDWKFFIDLHQKSPATYNMLSTECNWKLPNIEMMKSLLDGENH